MDDGENGQENVPTGRNLTPGTEDMENLDFSGGVLMVHATGVALLLIFKVREHPLCRYHSFWQQNIFKLLPFFNNPHVTPSQGTAIQVKVVLDSKLTQ